MRAPGVDRPNRGEKQNFLKFPFGFCVQVLRADNSVSFNDMKKILFKLFCIATGLAIANLSWAHGGGGGGAGGGGGGGGGSGGGAGAAGGGNGNGGDGGNG